MNAIDCFINLLKHGRLAQVLHLINTHTMDTVGELRQHVIMQHEPVFVGGHAG